MDTLLSTFFMFLILMSLSLTCKSETDCYSDNFELFSCCFKYPSAGAQVFNVKCPENTSLIDIVEIVHFYNTTSMCSDAYLQHTCNNSNPEIVWRTPSNGYLSNETCLSTLNECRFEIHSQIAESVCHDLVNSVYSDAVILRFKCIGSSDSKVSATLTTPTNFVSKHAVTTTSQSNELNSTPKNLPTSSSRDDDEASTIRVDDESSYEISSVSRSRPLSSTSTTLESAGQPPNPTKQQSSAAGAIGGGIAAVVVAIVMVIIIIFLVRRRKLQEKKNNFNNEKSGSNEHTYTDVDYSKTSPHKSKYEEANATQEKDFPLKHCDSHETSHYCYVGRNECHGKGHTNDEEKPQYDNVENMTYDTPKTNRVDNQDQNHYDNINEEVENKNNERVDLYAVPNKAKGESGDTNKMSLKRNMDGSEYSIYPTLPAKCFDTLAEDPDRPKYAEIDMEKSGISASSRKNVDAKPSEDLNYAQIQF